MNRKKILSALLAVFTAALCMSAVSAAEFKVPDALKSKNLALSAAPSASSVDAPNYTIECINDGVNGTGFSGSWCNDGSANSPTASDCWVQLTWDKPVTFNLVTLYTVEKYELGEFTVQYGSGNKWIDAAKVVNNSSPIVDIALENKVTTDKMRIHCLKGVYNSVDQIHFARVTEIEVYDSVATTPQAILKYAAENMDIGNTTAVTENIKLPDKTLEDTVGVSWKSKTPDVISSDGIIKRASFGEGDKKGVLEAVFSMSGESYTAEYEITVKELPEDGILVKEAADKLSVGDTSAVVTNISLPSKDSGGYCDILWSTSDSAHITADGKITRESTDDINAVLTAEIKKGAASVKKSFDVKILRAPMENEIQTTETWRAAEIDFISDKTYEMPYIDVDIEAEFTGPSGQIMVMPGFWYEGNTWKIRFAPTEEGVWTYTVRCTDTSNTSLHGRYGKIECVPYDGELDIYRHGFITRRDGSRFLTYADGTPFFYLGCGGWFTLSFKTPLYSSNALYMGSSAYKTWVDKRKSQGYNSFRTNFFIGTGTDVNKNGMHNENGFPWGGKRLSCGESSGDGSKHLWANSIFDGNEETYWNAGNVSYPQWAYVDYEEQRIVDGVKIVFGREDTWHFKVQASFDRENWEDIHDMTAGFTGSVYEFKPTGSVTGRFFRLLITGCASGKAASVAELYLYDQNGNAMNHGYYFRDMNPEFFKNVDEKIQYVANSGMNTDLGLDWGTNIQKGSTDDFKRFARYVVARYGAYPTLWFTAGEAGVGPIEEWISIAKYTKSIDPYDRVNTIHNSINNPDYSQYSEDMDWYDVTYTQSGHSRTDVVDIEYWKSMYYREPVRPFIESELVFENILGNPTKNTVEGCWKTIMAGGVGFCYSAEGLWQSTMDYNDNHQLWGDAPIPWYVALNKDGARRIGLMKEFIEDLSWWELAPSDTAVEWSNPPKGIPAPYQKSNSDSSVVIGYIPSNDYKYTGTVHVRPNSIYTARWFDTVNGAYITIGEDIKVGQDGCLKLPEQPDRSVDWAFVVTLNTVNTEIFNSLTPDRMTSEQMYAITSDLIFPQEENVVWESSNTEIIDNGGQVTRPENDTDVVIAAKIKTAAGTDVKYFNFTVKGKE